MAAAIRLLTRRCRATLTALMWSATPATRRSLRRTLLLLAMAGTATTILLLLLLLLLLRTGRHRRRSGDWSCRCR